MSELLGVISAHTTTVASVNAAMIEMIRIVGESFVFDACGKLKNEIR
jgi:hypothetical protein